MAAFKLAKTIAVSDDVYELLKKAKTHGESYSDVIRRGLKRSVKLTDIAGSGTITTEQWLKTRKVLRASEDLSQRKLRKILH